MSRRVKSKNASGGVLDIWWRNKMKKFLLVFTLIFTLSGGAQPVNAPKINPDEPLPANLFVKLAQAVNPAVVNVFTTYLPRGRMGNNMDAQDPFMELFEQFMGPQQYGRQMPQQSLGTGFIIREDGLIV